MAIEHLWATWRSLYVTGGSSVSVDDGAPGTLFERILGAPGTDRERNIVSRGEHCFVLLNLFPYTSGHLMVLPNVGVARLDQLDRPTHDELWRTVSVAVTALELGFGCHGVNVGINLGPSAGGSQSDHLHVHCVPRWVGDTNFMGAVTETRVLPIPLDQAHDSLVAVWAEATRQCETGPNGTPS